MTQPSDHDVVLGFESIGDNCELGILQRRVGVEPLGLLRFAGAPLRHVIKGLNARFAGIADPASIRIEAENGEYMVKLAAYDFVYHADVLVGDKSAEAVHTQQCRVLGFLANKLIADLEQAAKILVFRQNEPLLASDLIDLRLALAAYGPNKLLWVQEAGPGHPPGTVDVIDGHLMAGYVRRLASRQDVPSLDTESWLKVLRRAHAIAGQAVDGRLVRQPPVAGERTELIFGRDGDAGPALGGGWSGPEAGFTWAIGERSTLTIDVPGPAGEYWLEMDVRPFLAPPLLPRQRLDVAIDGGWAHSFFAVPTGEIACAIPGRLIGGRNRVEITLGHPHAASPMLIAGQGDDRRLGIAFHRLSLVRC